MDTLTKERRSNLMRRIGRKNTAPELLVREALTELGFHYRLHAGDLPGNPDIVNRRKRIALFVHGCFWHGHYCRRGALPKSNIAFWTLKLERNKQRDRLAVSSLRRQGWRVLVVWQCQLTSRTKLVERLRRFLIAK